MCLRWFLWCSSACRLRILGREADIRAQNDLNTLAGLFWTMRDKALVAHHFDEAIVQLEDARLHLEK